MRSVLLELYGFDEDELTLLSDLDATKANIESGLRSLLERSEPGDVLYFHFSGHGSNVPDDNGDEADNRDEIFCPTDLDWADPLRDDWLRTLFDGLPSGLNLTAVTDCCHSGSITRAPKPPDAPVKERFLPCPLDLWATESARELTGVRRNGRGEVATGPVDDVHLREMPEVLLTGCRADQFSADAFIDGDYHGALTHSLAAALREGGAGLSCARYMPGCCGSWPMGATTRYLSSRAPAIGWTPASWLPSCEAGRGPSQGEPSWRVRRAGP